MMNCFGVLLVLGVALFYNWSPLMRAGVFFGISVEPEFPDSEAGRSITRRYRALLWSAAAVAAVLAFAVPVHPGHASAGLCAGLLLEWLASTVAFIVANRAASEYQKEPSTVRTVELLGAATAASTRLKLIAVPIAVAAAGVVFAVCYPWQGSVPLFAGRAVLAARFDELVAGAAGGTIGAGLGLLLSCTMILLAIRFASRRTTPLAQLTARTMLTLAFAAALCVTLTVTSGTLGYSVAQYIGRTFAVGVICITLIHFVLGVRQNKVNDPCTSSVEIGDNLAWHWGLFYNNQNDPALLVQKRSGPGYTVNFGHPIAWPITALFFLLVGYVVASGVWR